MQYRIKKKLYVHTTLTDKSIYNSSEDSEVCSGDEWHSCTTVQYNKCVYIVYSTLGLFELIAELWKTKYFKLPKCLVL